MFLVKLLHHCSVKLGATCFHLFVTFYCFHITKYLEYMWKSFLTCSNCDTQIAICC